MRLSETQTESIFVRYKLQPFSLFFTENITENDREEEYLKVHLMFNLYRAN